MKSNDRIRYIASQIGAACMQERARSRRSASQVARRLGISVEFYARIEAGDSLPSIMTLSGLVDELHIDARKVLRGLIVEGRDERSSGSLFKPGDALTTEPGGGLSLQDRVLTAGDFLQLQTYIAAGSDHRAELMEYRSSWVDVRYDGEGQFQSEAGGYTFLCRHQETMRFRWQT